MNIIKLFRKNSKKRQQEILLEFVNNTENIKRAAEGSMEKRIELIERVAKKQTA
jgi:hypothetical protein